MQVIYAGDFSVCARLSFGIVASPLEMPTPKNTGTNARAFHMTRWMTHVTMKFQVEPAPFPVEVLKV